MFSTLNRFASPHKIWVAAGLSIILGLAVGRIHLRVQTTLIGYEIGKLKGEEGKLLEERALLKMQLAKLTTRRHLQMMAEAESESGIEAETVAAK